MRHLLCAFALAALAAATGCAELRQAVAPESVEFELAGRIAMRYRDEAGSGNLAWRHARDGDELLLTTPIGNSIARVVRDGQETVLTTANGEQHRARDVEALTAQVLGFPLPLAGLADWVRGRPIEGEPAQVSRDALGRLESVRQSGWVIEYQDFGPDGLPVRLKLTYPGIELRLAIHQWSSRPAGGPALR